MIALSQVITILLFIISSNVSSLEGTRIISHEEELFNDIFQGYNPTARPVLDSNDSVEVSLSLQVRYIHMFI